MLSMEEEEALAAPVVRLARPLVPEGAPCTGQVVVVVVLHVHQQTLR